METNDGTKVGELKNKAWNIQSLSTKTGDPQETLKLVKNDKVLRPDLVTVQAFRVRKNAPWHKFIFTAEAMPIPTKDRRLLQAPGRRDGPKPVAFEATVFINSNNNEDAANGGINQVTHVDIGGAAVVCVCVCVRACGLIIGVIGYRCNRVVAFCWK